MMVSVQNDLPKLSDNEHREQLAIIFEWALMKLVNAKSRAVAMEKRRRQTFALDQKTSVHLDNIATKYAPVWRARVTTPLTPRAVRHQLMAQANELHQLERQRYVRRRLTALDCALDDDQADALERWLLCEELLAGRVKIGNYGDQTSGGKNNASPIPDSMLALVQVHMEDKRFLDHAALHVLAKLAEMTAAPFWDFGEAGREMYGTALGYSQAKRRFIRAVTEAAGRLSRKSA